MLFRDVEYEVGVVIDLQLRSEDNAIASPCFLVLQRQMIALGIYFESSREIDDKLGRGGSHFVDKLEEEFAICLRILSPLASQLQLIGNANRVLSIDKGVNEAAQ